MKRLIDTLFISIIFAALIPSMAVAAPKSPEKLAHQTVQKVISSLNGRREELKNNPKELYQLIDKELVPLIDLPYMSQLVLGRYWRQATPEQRKQFETAFKNMLVHTYGQGLLKLKSNNQIEYLPVRAPDDAKRVTFNAIIETNDGKRVKVGLKLHLVDGQWKVYDGSIGDLSFVTNYRGQFTTQIRRTGLEDFIKRMEKRYNPG